MPIDAKDLIIIDSTIISGILILLTISSFSPDEFPNRSVFVSIAVFVVIFFSISSIYVLLENISKAMRYTKIGFVSIIFFMVFIGIVNIINIIDPDIWNQQSIVSKIATNSILS